MWYILDGDDNSFSIVHEKNILQAGSVINVKDKVRFVYRGEECHGTVIFKHAYHDRCNEKLKQLTKEDKEAKAKAKSQAIENPKPLPSKRTHARTLVFGSAAANEDISSKKKKKEVQPKTTEAEKTRLRILKLNKEQSQRMANQMILQKQRSPKIQKSSDTEWTPEDEISQDSIVNLGQFKAGLASSNNDLCRKLLKSRSPSPNNGSRSPSPSRNKSGCSSPRVDQNVSPTHNSDFTMETDSPSKEELMKQIQLLHEKLNRKKDKPTPQVNEASGNTKQSEAVNSTNNPTDETPEKDGDELVKSTKDDLERSMEGNSSSFSKAERSDDIDMPEVDVDKINDDLLGYQLYGNKPHTTEIGNNIFCDKDVLKQALANATNINHLVRRLMAGVFIPSKIINCTVTGQAWHAGGEEKLKEKKDPLHGGALKAIVAFSNSFAKTKKMHTEKFEKCKPIFSGRLIEIKNQVKSGKLKDVEG